MARELFEQLSVYQFRHVQYLPNLQSSCSLPLSSQKAHDGNTPFGKTPFWSNQHSVKRQNCKKHSFSISFRGVFIAIQVKRKYVILRKARFYFKFVSLLFQFLCFQMIVDISKLYLGEKLYYSYQLCCLNLRKSEEVCDKNCHWLAKNNILLRFKTFFEK